MRIGMRIVIIVLLSVACVGLCLAGEPKQSRAPETSKQMLESSNVVRHQS